MRRCGWSTSDLPFGFEAGFVVRETAGWAHLEATVGYGGAFGGED